MNKVEYLTVEQLGHSDTFLCYCYLCNGYKLQKLMRDELLSDKEMEEVLKYVDKYVDKGVPYPIAKLRCMSCQNHNKYAVNIYANKY